MTHRLQQLLSIPCRRSFKRAVPPSQKWKQLLGVKSVRFLWTHISTALHRFTAVRSLHLSELTERCSIVKYRKRCLLTILNVSIVAVPGLGSHAFGTWKSRHGYKMWLREFLPKDKAFQNSRIMLYGYRSTVKDSTSSDSIQDHSRRLLLQLQNIQREEKVY
jgi:hypothetical protein